jgi:sulfite exporter TauE/SafE
MIKTLLEGFFLGISTGSLCLMTCSPIYLPYIMTSDRKLSRSLLAVGEISAGRFISYLTFGALAGVAGANISAINRNFYGAIANILLSIYLVLTVIRSDRSEKKCHVPKIAAITRSGLLLGILTGINFCPAFLIALSEAVNLGGAISGILLFLGFFFGTTLYLVPLAFASLLTQIKKMKYIARILSLIVAAWFIYKGTTGLVEHFNQPDPEDIRIVDVFHPANKLTVISAPENLPYFLALRDSLAYKTNENIELFIWNKTIPDSILNTNYIFFTDNTINLDESFESRDLLLVEPGYDISPMLNWLQKFTFQVSEPLNWEFAPHDH